MRIKIIKGCSGSTFSFAGGQEVEVDEAIAQDLIKAQYAKELVDEPSTVTGSVNDNNEKAPEVTMTKTDEDEPPKETPPKAPSTKKTTKAKK